MKMPETLKTELKRKYTTNGSNMVTIFAAIGFAGVVFSTINVWWLIPIAIAAIYGHGLELVEVKE